MPRLIVIVAIVIGALVLPSAAARAQVAGDLPIEIVPTTQHTQETNSIAFSSDDDDRLVASCGDDGVIKLWDVRTGRLIRNVVRIDPNNKYWRVKSLSSDGRWLLGIVADRYKIWNTLTGREVASIPTPSDHSEDDRGFMSRDGSRVATIRTDKTIKLLDAQTGKELSTLKNAKDFVFSKDGKRAISATYDKKIELWDAQTGNRIRTLTILDEVPESIGYSADERRIAIKSTSGLTKLWDADNDRVVAELSGNVHSTSLFSSDGAYWAFADGNDTVEILHAGTGARYSTFKLPAEHASILEFSRDNRLLLFTPVSLPDRQPPDWVLLSVSSSSGQVVSVAKGSPDAESRFGSRFYLEDDKGTLRLRDLETWQEVRTFIGQSSLSASTFSPTGSRLAVAVAGRPSVLDSETGQRIGTCPASSGEIYAFAFSSDGRQLLYGGEDKTIVLCDFEHGAAIRSFVGHEASVKSVAFSADARQAASGDETGMVKLWEVATGKVLRTFKGNERSADVLAFSPDARKLLAGTDDNKVRIWDLATAREAKTLRMLIGPVKAMTVSPDGRRVAAGPYSDLMVKQWEIETGKELRRLESGYGGRFVSVSDIKYSGTNERVLAASSNNYIVLWDIDSGRKKVEVSYPDQDFKSIAFASDGRRLVSVDEAGVVRHWDKSTGALALTIISFGDGEWLRVTPEGFFDASPNGTKYLTVVRGLEVYSIDRVYDKLHRPDLVREKLAGDPQGKVKEAAAKLDLTKLMAGGG